MADSARNAALVIGVGPHQGLGAAVARRLGAEGLHVFVSGRTAARLEECAADVRSSGGAATAVAADATLPADVERVFGAVDEAGLPLEPVVERDGIAEELGDVGAGAELADEAGGVPG